MNNKRTLQSKPRAVRKLIDYFSCDEEERRGGSRPWVNTSDSDTSQSDSNNKSSPITIPCSYGPHPGYWSDSSPCKYLPPIGVFWDIENCQIPRGRSAVAVAQAIRDKFFDGYREAEFLVVCDVKKETSQVIQELNDAQVNLIHVGSHCKNAADEKLRQSIRRFADLHGSLAAIVLISGDINFAPDLCDLRHRKKIHVILVHNDLCSESLMLCANEHYRFSDLVASLPYRGAVKSEYQPAEVTVSSLPVAMDPGKVRMRLKRLAENCGGRVSVVLGELATVRFPSIEFAMRAQKRMDGEMVFGSQIAVSHPTICRDQKLSPVKVLSRCTSTRWEDQQGVLPNQPQKTLGTHPIPPPLPLNGFFGANFQRPSLPFFNQENVPFPVPAKPVYTHVNIPVQTQIRPKQTTVGRPILGRRNEPNYQQNPQINPSCASGRHSLDSMLDSGEVNGGTKRSQSPSPMDCNNQGGRKCRTPSPHSLLGVNTSIPPPPIVNLPRSKDSEYFFHPIPQSPAAQPLEPTELLVTNLDQSIDLIEMKKLLTFAFSQHCSVLNVMVFMQTDGTLAATVRVRSQQDVVQVVDRLQNHSIGNSQIRITYAQTCNASRNELVATRIQTPSPASSTDTTEVLYCMCHSQEGSIDTALPYVTVYLSDFTTKLTALVTSHDNRLPLASLVDCYAAEFQPLVGDGQSVPLEHLVTCVRGVELVTPGKAKYLRLCVTVSPTDDTSLAERSSSSLSRLNVLGEELVELLKNHPRCQILFNRLIPAYYQHFSKHCKVTNYGCSKLIELLNNLSSVVQVMGEGNNRVVALSHRAQMSRFTADLLLVLRSQASKQLYMLELASLWERVIGHALKPADYGLCYVEDLLSQVSKDSVLMTGHGQATMLAIPRRAQTPAEKERTKHFATQVVELLSRMPLFSVDFTKFIPAYHHHFGIQCKLADFGFTKLIDLLEAIPHVIKIEGRGEGERLVMLTLPERLKVIASQISQLVVPRYPPGLALDSLNSAYLWEFGNALKPSSFECNSIVELLNKLPTVKITTSADGSMILTPVDRTQARILYLRTLRILWERSSARMSLADFEQMFQRYYQRSCSHLALVTELKDVVKVSEDGFVQLTSLQLFAGDVYRMLCTSDGRLAFSVFEGVYRRTQGAIVSPSQYGYLTTLDLLEAIDHVVTVSGKGPKRLLVLNTELAAVGIPLPPGMTKSADQTISSNHSDTSRPSPNEALMKVLNIKSNSEKPAPLQINREVNVSPATWNTDQKGEHIANGVSSENSNHIKEDLKKEQSLTLLSPADFLLPASALSSFIPPSPDPSTLPKPGKFCFTQENQMSNSMQFLDDVHLNDQNKRGKLRLAAHFGPPIQLK